MKLYLNMQQKERLIDLMNEYLDGVKSGSICGFGQSLEYEIEDCQAILDILKRDDS